VGSTYLALEYRLAGLYGPSFRLDAAMWVHLENDGTSCGAESPFRSAVSVLRIASRYVGVSGWEVVASSPDYSCAVCYGLSVCERHRLTPSHYDFSFAFWTKTKNR
jgi:hypothetical protein